MLRIFLSMKKKKKILQTIRVSNFWSNSYIEYENNGDRNKILSVEEYLNKIKPYLTNINNFKTCEFNEQYQITLFLPWIMMNSV